MPEDIIHLYISLRMEIRQNEIKKKDKKKLPEIQKGLGLRDREKGWKGKRDHHITNIYPEMLRAHAGRRVGEHEWCAGQSEKQVTHLTMLGPSSRLPSRPPGSTILGYGKLSRQHHKKYVSLST